MHQPQRFRSVRGLLSGLVLVSSGVVSACGAGSDPVDGAAGSAGVGTPGAGSGGSGATSSGAGGTGNSVGGTGNGTAGASGGSSVGGGAGGALSGCVGTQVTTPKRLVRLTENQIANAYSTLFGATQAAAITKDEDIEPAILRAFPPLQGATSIGDTLFNLSDRLAQGAMKHVAANLATVTTCGAAPTDAMCGQNFLLSFAEKAFRRPLLDAERTAITTELFAEMSTDGATVSQAIQYGVYGILSAPGFLYRTEFGDNSAVDGAITQTELASELAFFVTDAPPDAELLAAAKAGKLATPEEVRTQVTRLLMTPTARTNLEAALVGYFGLPRVTTLVIDAQSLPGIVVSGGLLNSLFHESELFFRNTLWNGPLSDLITSRRTWVNSQIAMPIYGVAPPTQLDADMFGPIELPADRTGLLTLAGFLTSKSRPDKTSVVGRGLAINQTLICQENPPFPDGNTTVEEAIDATASLSQKEQADFRAGNALCSTCHKLFDSFGLVLEPYDSIGRFRTQDLQGRLIDANTTRVTLPVAAGGMPVASAADVAKALISSGALNSCMAMNLINFALADVSQGGANVPQSVGGPPTGGCAVKDVVTRFQATDQTFTSLIREIAASQTLALRSRGL